MYLAIQASNPAVIGAAGKRVPGPPDAIATIFPDETEEAYLLWDAVPIRINYKYDWSVMIDDVPGMLDKLMRESVGEHRVFWGSSSFMAEWKMSWSGGKLAIASTWKHIAGGYEDLLNRTSSLEIGQDEFVWEWKALLDRTITCIDRSGIEIVKSDQLDTLRSIEAAIPRFGRLYPSLA
jgi:hypothetical protein